MSKRIKTLKPEPGPPEMRDSAAFNLISAAQLIRRHDDAYFEQILGISVRQFISLVALRDRPGIGAAQLARQLHITAQSGTTLIEVLTKLGYIEVDRAGAGQRLGLRISPQGEAMVERGRDVMHSMDAAKRTWFEPGEWEELNRLLIKLVTVFQPYQKV